MAEEKMYSLVKSASKVKQEDKMVGEGPRRPSMSFTTDMFKSLKGKKFRDKVDIHLKGEIVGIYSRENRHESSDRVEIEFDFGGLVNIPKEHYKAMAKK